MSPRPPWPSVRLGPDVSALNKCCQPDSVLYVPSATADSDFSNASCAPANRLPVCAKSCTFFYRPLTCPEKYGLFDNESWQVVPGGISVNSSGVGYNATDYCLEEVLTSQNVSLGVHAFLCFPPEQNTGLCFPWPEKRQDHYLFAACYFISSAFTLATFAALVIVKTSSFERITIFFLFHLFFGQLNYGIILIVCLPITLCILQGFAVQFFFLATFFWLNVMCIDIYWAFSDLRSLGGAGGTWRDHKKLMCYSAYAWGMPLLILGVTIAVDYMPSVPTTSRFKPAMGLDKCFFRGRIAGWTYFYGPMAVILLMNCLLFAITAFHLYRHRRDACVLKRGDSRRHGPGSDKERYRFNLYLKLFLVMGINWLSEVISFTFNKDVPRYLWYLTDITNTLQGVFIFLIFVWKRRLWHNVRRRREPEPPELTESPGLNEPIDPGEQYDETLTDDELTEEEMELYRKLQPAPIPDNSHEHDS